MQVNAKFGAERRFQLNEAVLIYSETGSNMLGGDRNVVAATIHAIDEGKVMPGRPITMEAVEALAHGLGRRLENTILPERMLSITMSRMAWWCPARRGRIWFNPAKHKQAKELKALNGKFVQHPALLFVVEARQMAVFALAQGQSGCQRPTATTRVYRAPYYNLAPEGDMCRGTANLPDTMGPSSMEAFEKAFFDSAFSHSNWGHRLTTHPGGHLGLWQAMVKRKAPFPDRYLVRTKQNVAQVIASKVDDE
jgi:PRTRC genetic system protein B